MSDLNAGKGKRLVTRVQVSEDELWRHYGDSSLEWETKCARCRLHVEKNAQPGPEALSCWKVEVWFSGSFYSNCKARMDMDQLAEELIRRTLTVAKVSKMDMPVERTGLPNHGYPDKAFDRLLMAYAQSPSERDVIRLILCEILGAESDDAAQIPARRGCWAYDHILGPWITWAPYH